MKKKILIADDESRMRILISDFLINEGYEVIEALNGREAVDKFVEDPSIHLVILDIMMPVLNGFDTCSQIRKISKVPILMLTAKNTENDELQGFRKGTDEYIKKPFSPSVLVARINALMLRIYGDSKKISKGNLLINSDSHLVEINGASIDLSQTEFKLLLYLIENENRVLSRDQLLNYVWGYDYDGTERTVDTHMNRLRIKLKSSGNYLKTVRGFGYKFKVTP
ncbi:MAG: response regulator transcription factor [Bacteroidetes bacterium]|nr:response regulator transcription factor [Bacteroidota bacterium]